MSMVNGCWFRATTGGTSSFEVASAITGYMTPAQADAVDAETYGYRAESDDNSQWEIGEGVYTASGTLLSRSVLKSSNSNAAVNFSAAPRVMLTPLASDFGGGGGGAWEVVSEGTITTPVEYIDVNLPTGYREFILQIRSLAIDTEDALMFGLSPDGGSTFNNADYEVNVSSRFSTSTSNVVENNYDEALGALAYWSFYVSANMNVDAAIYPGGPSQFPIVRAEWPGYVDSEGTFMMEHVNYTRLKVNGRANLMRIVPYGFGDIDPPTFGSEFTTGYWRLLGWTE